MAVKRTGQPSFVEVLLATKGGGGSLDRLSGLVKWYRFEKVIGHLRDEAGPGRPGYPALVLFKALLLQSLYGLSDRELEEALDDRLSFRRFAGLSVEEAVPDHTVLFDGIVQARPASAVPGNGASETSGVAGPGWRG